MKPFSDRMILAFLAGALDPSHARRLSSELDTDPQLRARAAVLRARLIEPVDPPRWRLPPLGVPVGLRAEFQAEAMMGTGLRPGDLVRIRVLVADDTPRQVVVLARHEAIWSVLAPQSSDEILALADLEMDVEGRRVLYLTVDDAPEVQLRAVLLPPLDLPVDWALAPEARWRALQALLDEGDVPVIAVEIVLERSEP